MNFQRWILIPPLLILSIILVACGDDGGQRDNRKPTQSAPVGEVNQNNGNAGATVNVVATEFKLTLDKTEAQAGTITFTLTNNGHVPHDFTIIVDGREHNTALLQPGERGSVTVDLQPGSYHYICSIEGHDMLGMEGDFIIR